MFSTGFTRTKRDDWYTATYQKATVCAEGPDLNCPDGTVVISVWYDVHSRSWVVATLDGNGWDSGPTEYYIDRDEAFAVARRWATCPH